MPSRSSFRQITGEADQDVDVLAPAVPAEDHLVLGLSQSRGPTAPSLPSP